MDTNKIDLAAIESAGKIANSKPYWVDVLTAGEFLTDLPDKTVLHSGPPIVYDKMCPLHKKGIISAVLFERWADSEEKASALIESGEIKIDSANNYNTVGSGTGIITKSVPLLIVCDKNTNKKAGVFPSEGKFGGGFCGWGLFSEEIARNLHYLKSEVFDSIRPMLKDCGGLPLKPILEESLKMGDENHSRQRASGLLFIEELVPRLLKSNLPKGKISEIANYFFETDRFFHNFGQSAFKSACLSAHNIEGSPIVTAAGGNGVEFGIKVSGLGEQWFTAESPMIMGRYMTEGCRVENQLPWIGDSSIVECAGMGGMSSAASPIVCSYRDETLSESIKNTKRMKKITTTESADFCIPNMDFECISVGIDIRKVIQFRITPIINGGMISRSGGWMGAGYAHIPFECFEGAAEAFRKKYGG